MLLTKCTKGLGLQAYATMFPDSLISLDLNPPPLVEAPEIFYWSCVPTCKSFLHFLSRDRKRRKRARPCPASSCASSRRPEHAETRFAQTVRAL